MRFSIIMPSRLIPYANSALYPDQKIVRSIESVLDQTFTDFELIVIADGCQQTKDIVTNQFTDKRLVLLECQHKQIFDNMPRNTGIDNAKGEYIIYIDIDDWWGSQHLEIVNRNLKSFDWVCYNDYTFKGEWIPRHCNPRQLGGCGTSNVCYKRSLKLKWGRPGYAHDYYFIQQLRNFKNFAKIETPEYFVCHIPIAAGGYDL